VGYLDGIRGLAALYVLLEHIQLCGLEMIDARHASPANATLLQNVALFLNSTVLGYGHLAVDIFIVLSGYCLMLPVTTSPERTLRGGFIGYIKRRALRILPPYYAALGLAVLMGALVLGRGMPDGAQLISHVLLVHNFSERWLFGINAPLWSIAIEWQIYFVFAAILLPAWRWGGVKCSLLVALLLGLAPLYLLPIGRNFEWSCPWYITLFALGMAAASIQWGGVRRWRAASLWFAVVTIVVFAFQQLPWARRHWSFLFRMESRGASWPLDVMVGVTFACALVSLARTDRCHKDWINRYTLRVLQSGPVSRLGAFSYSLYLIHLPVVAVVGWGLFALKLSPIVTYIALYVFGIPAGLVGGYLLFMAVERHCMSRPFGKSAALGSRSPLASPGGDTPAAPTSDATGIVKGIPELAG
jgi:peptidoglycan/LPS O-acetylase OafA/YrhL